MPEAQTYPDCAYCGGEVKFKRVTRELHWRGQLYLLENAPVGVCQQCGEKFVTAQDAIQMERRLKAGQQPDHFVQVPAYIITEPVEAA